MGDRTTVTITYNAIDDNVLDAITNYQGCPDWHEHGEPVQETVVCFTDANWGLSNDLKAHLRAVATEHGVSFVVLDDGHPGGWAPFEWILADGKEGQVVTDGDGNAMIEFDVITGEAGDTSEYRAALAAWNAQRTNAG